MFPSTIALYLLAVANIAFAASIPRHMEMMPPVETGPKENGPATSGTGGYAGGGNVSSGDHYSLVEAFSGNGGNGGNAPSGDVRAGDDTSMPASGCSACGHGEHGAHEGLTLLNLLPINQNYGPDHEEQREPMQSRAD